jgi:hypothetical protein
LVLKTQWVNTAQRGAARRGAATLIKQSHFFTSHQFPTRLSNQTSARHFVAPRQFFLLSSIFSHLQLLLFR